MKLPVFIMATAALGVSFCSDTNGSENTDVEEYLFLELSMGLHDPAQVDAYFGPEQLQKQAETEQLSLDEIAQRATKLTRSMKNPGFYSMPRPPNMVRLFFRKFSIRLILCYPARDRCRNGSTPSVIVSSSRLTASPKCSRPPWGGYNWYQGNANSLIQVNTDLPSHIDSAVSLGCHEGYPGHHTYNALLEQKLVLDKGWQEFSLYPLFSPQSLLAEGSANYGIELAFPGDERVEFEREYLFPLAGLDASDADRYYQLAKLRAQLDYAINEAARHYLDGQFSSDQAQEWLINYALDSPERAEKRISFFDTYRSYVINYNYGQDLVAEWVNSGGADSALRWKRFIQLLSEPMSPTDLIELE